MAGLGDMFGQSMATVNGQKPRNSDRIQPSQPLNLRGAFEAATNIPVVGDALSGGMALYDAAKGDYGSAAMNALGVLPFVSGTFIGKGAKTWDAIKAADAEKRIAAGDDVRKVWKDTGTFKGPDGHLRQEIPDNKALYRGSKAADSSYAEDVFLHPELYDNYPVTKGNRVIEFKGTGGSFEPHPMTKGAGKIRIGTEEGASSTAVHELQHAIQQKEGWANGGNTTGYDAVESSHEYARWNAAQSALPIRPSSVQISETMDLYDKIPNRFEAYQRLAGEAEARATQSRMNMNMEQRLNTYPLDSYDVPIDQLIIRGNTPIGSAFGGK